VNSAGVYTVTVTSSNGCQAADEVEIAVESCLSIVEFENEIQLYPNPAVEAFTIESLDALTGSYQLVSFDGKLHRSGRLSSDNKVTINIESLSKGVYMIRLDLETGTREYRIVKQ